PGYGTVVGVYQSSKNTLTIGGVEKDLHTPYGSTSKGPTKDGRIKPELVTIGVDIYSCDLYDKYRSMEGTSMACPGATGAIALISQRYKQLHGNANPSNALLKALAL